MTVFRVVFTPEARSDLQGVYDYIADRAGADVALAYVERIQEHCRRLETFPERGTLRGDIRPGLRIIGFEHRVTIAFQIRPEDVVVTRILYGGGDIEENLY